MKVPVYKKQISYQAVPAQNVELAKPLYQSISAKKTKKMQTLQTMQDGIDLVQHMQGLLKKKKQTQGRDASFVDSSRKELLRFCQEKLFSQPNFQTSDFAPVEKLDSYVNERFAYKNKKELWVEDYAVLRREVEKMQEAYQQESQLDQWNQAGQTFLEYAALIENPQALQEYIQENLLQAKAQFPTKQDQVKWQEMQEDLSARAVEYNVLSALQSGQDLQAQKVFDFFKDKLPVPQQELLNQKITYSQISRQAKEMIADAQNQIFSPDGQIQVEKLEELAGHKSKREEEKEAWSRALKKCAGQCQRQHFLHQAKMYERLLAEDQTEQEVLSRANFSFSNQEDFELCALALAERGKSSQAEKFNQLYEEKSSFAGKNNRLKDALKKGEINGRDFLKLKTIFLRQAVEEEDREEVLIRQAVHRLCQQKNLDKKQAEELKYYVFSAEGGSKGRWKAAVQARKILDLQEDKR